MTTTIVPARQKLRNTTGGLATKVGFVGLFAYDITKKTAVVFDGTTYGGFALAREDLANVPQPASDDYIPMDVGTIANDGTQPANDETHGLFGWIKKVVANINFLFGTNGLYIATCSTASATAQKEVTISNFVLTTGVRFKVKFTNHNTADVPTIKINSLDALSIKNEDNVVVSAEYPAYFPAGATIDFYYDGTYAVFENKVVISRNYLVSGFKRKYIIRSDGYITQSGKVSAVDTVTLPFTMMGVEDVLTAKVTAVATSSTGRIIAVKDNSTTSVLNVLRNDSGFQWSFEVTGYFA